MINEQQEVWLLLQHLLHGRMMCHSHNPDSRACSIIAFLQN